MAGIVYISENRPDLLDDICNENYTAVTAKIRETNLKELIVKKSANLSHAEPLVVDLSSLKDSAAEIEEAVTAFKCMYPKKRIVVLADRENPQSLVFSRLLDSGVYNIAVNLEYETLKKCLFENMTQEDTASLFVETAVSQQAAKPAENPAPAKPKEPEFYDRITANREFKKHKEYIFVAVCGTEPHIGTTHQSLMITKFLCGAGFKACYFEANKRIKINHIADLYTVNINESTHLIQFEGIDMYYKQNLSEILKEKYDFIIFDFGSFEEIKTPAVFLEKDIKVIVGGVKAWEMPAYWTIFNKITGSRGINFIANFAPPLEVNEIKKSMAEWKLYFSDYVPHPFSGGNPDIYKEIFSDYVTVERVQKTEFPEKKRKNFFKFWG
jgi:hypothetical protein